MYQVKFILNLLNIFVHLNPSDLRSKCYYYPHSAWGKLVRVSAWFAQGHVLVAGGSGTQNSVTPHKSNGSAQVSKCTYPPAVEISLSVCESHRGTGGTILIIPSTSPWCPPWPRRVKWNCEHAAAKKREENTNFYFWLPSLWTLIIFHPTRTTGSAFLVLPSLSRKMLLCGKS